MKNPKILILLLIINCGCVVINDFNNKSIPLNKNNYSKINGSFYNSPSQSKIEAKRDYINKIHPPSSLWNVVHTIHSGQKDLNLSESVKIEFDGKSKMHFFLYNDSVLVSSRMIKGKLKDGYFVKRRKFILIPFFPFYYWYNTQYVRVGLSEDGLIVDHKWNYWGVVIIGGGNYSKGVSYNLYSKK